MILGRALSSLLIVACLPGFTASAFPLRNLFSLWRSEGVRSSKQHVLDGADDRTSSPGPHPAAERPVPAFPRHPSRNTTGFIALGDSYNAGIGTGFEGKEDECRRGLHAYPSLMFDDLAARNPTNATYAQLLACTGSTTEDVLSGADLSQLDQFNSSNPADFALLSVGGNDLGFFDVMNACVFRFYSFYSGTCEMALQQCEDRIASDLFDQRLQLVIMEILHKVRWEVQPWFTVTVTGYTRFFNDETDLCDECSFGVWWRGPRLTRELRHRMNKMVLDVNNKIRLSVDKINARFSRPKVIFVDYDSQFDGHRFCEPDVIEPAYNRTDTWFFLVGGADNSPGSSPNGTEPPIFDPPPGDPINTPPPGLAHDSALLSPSSLLRDPEMCLSMAERSGDWGELAICYMAMAMDRDPSLRFADGIVDAENSMWYVPTYYGKTFHPRSLGHEAIRDHVYRVWSEFDFEGTE